jgi:hypothetical protein
VAIDECGCPAGRTIFSSEEEFILQLVQTCNLGDEVIHRAGELVVKILNHYSLIYSQIGL